MSTISLQEAQIKSVIEAMALYADLQQFDALAKLFTSEIIVDYSSMWGGEPQSFTNDSLMTAWAQLLPGFNATRHELKNSIISVNQHSASATAEIVARHWLGEEIWEVSGTYHYHLTRNAEQQWQINRLTFLLNKEHGNRQLVEKAQQQASKNLPDYLRRQQNIETAKSFLSLLSVKNIESFLNLWAENGIQDMPFSPGEFPKKIAGKQALTRHWSGVSDFIGRMDFYDIEITPTIDPNSLIMQYRSEIEILTTNKLYQNDYLAMIEFDNFGKISRFLEYYDPIRLQQAWGVAADKVSEMANQ